jgi:hypothetical protein
MVNRNKIGHLMKQRSIKLLFKHIRRHETKLSILLGAISLGLFFFGVLRYSYPRMKEFITPILSQFYTVIGNKEEAQKFTQPPTIQKNSSEELNLGGLEVRTHKTTLSDTLWKLAVQYYNDGYRWTEIYEANKALIPNPNVLEKDLELVIPM